MEDIGFIFIAAAVISLVYETGLRRELENAKAEDRERVRKLRR